MTTNPPTPNFRALCKELGALMIELAFTHPNLSENGVRIVNELSDRADAALATPPPEPSPPYWPTKGEVIQFAMDTRLYRFQATAGEPIQYEMTEAQLIAFARALLEKWGK